MLDHMSALMRRHSRRGHAALIVNLLAEVHSLCLRIVVVGQAAWDASDFDIGDPVVIKHLAGDLRPGHAVGGRNP